MGHEGINVEIRRAVIGYCDVGGFMSWIERSEVAHRAVMPFIQKMTAMFLEFQRTTGYHIIWTGDGIIAVLDHVQNTAPPNVFGIINALSELRVEISSLAEHQPNPNPGESRIRITEGIVYRTEEPSFHNRAPNINFVGHPLNLGSRLLQWRRDITNIISESAYDSMTQEGRDKLIVEPVKVLGRPPRGVKIEELNGLLEFKIAPVEVSV